MEDAAFRLSTSVGADGEVPLDVARTVVENLQAGSLTGGREARVEKRMEEDLRLARTELERVDEDRARKIAAMAIARAESRGQGRFKSDTYVHDTSKLTTMTTFNLKRRSREA